MHGTCIRPQRSDTAQQTRHLANVVSMLASVAVVGPTLKQYWVNASFLLGGLHHVSSDIYVEIRCSFPICSENTR